MFEEKAMSTRMRDEKEKRKLTASEIILPLVIGTLGAVGAILAFFVLDFSSVEVMLLLVIVAGATIGYNRRTMRGLVTIPFLYTATGFATLAYEDAAPYIGAPFGDFRETEPTRAVNVLSFFVLMLVVWIALEGISRALFRDMSLPKLGILDNFGGVFVHMVIGVLIAALIFNALGYVQHWRENGSARSAQLAPAFLQVTRAIYMTQSFWFSGTPGLYRGVLGLTETVAE
jgi:uncharacterized membrane protein required for colicin V production